MTQNPSRNRSRWKGRRSPWSWFRDGGWYFVLVILSIGLLSPVPFAHAAGRLRDRRLWLITAVYTAAVATVFVLGSQAPKDADGQVVVGGALTTVQVLLTMVIPVVACLHLRSVRRRAYRLAQPGSDPAVTAALARRDRRLDARRLAVQDPALARELRVGRPDLPRDYDDGGLVDLNRAPARSIAEACGIDMSAAEQLVAARVGGVGSLGDVDDVFAYLDLPVESWDNVRERGIVIGAARRR
jgi:hypothetical protein